MFSPSSPLFSPPSRHGAGLIKGGKIESVKEFRNAHRKNYEYAPASLEFSLPGPGVEDENPVGVTRAIEVRYLSGWLISLSFYSAFW